MIDLTQYTHYAPDMNGFTCFTYETCENCGEKIYNSSASSPRLSGEGVERIFEEFGLQRVEKFPPDLVVDFHDDDDQEEEWRCDNCL